MTRAIGLVLIGALVLAGVALAQASDTSLRGTVGPGYSIKLTDPGGAALTRVDAGPAELEVEDLATGHNFHLFGPGGVDVSTTVEGTGKSRFAVTLVEGTYLFVCDPHADSMRGSFVVGAAGSPPPPSTPPPPPASPPPPAPAVKPPSVPVGSTMVLALGVTGRPVLRSTAGKLVTRLRPGGYKVNVRDRVATRGVKLAGAGAARATTRGYVGVASWSLRLRQGALRITAIPAIGAPVVVAVG